MFGKRQLQAEGDAASICLQSRFLGAPQAQERGPPCIASERFQRRDFFFGEKTPRDAQGVGMAAVRFDIDADPRVFAVGDQQAAMAVRPADIALRKPWPAAHIAMQAIGGGCAGDIA